MHDDLNTNILKPTFSTKLSNYYVPINSSGGGGKHPPRDLTAYPILSPRGKMFSGALTTSRLPVQ